MQLSELYRRAVVVPCDDQAEGDLRHWQASENTLVDSVDAGDDETFYRVWAEGIFSEMNKACGTRIGDYEEELVEPSKIDGLLGIIEKGMRQLRDVKSERFFADLAGLLKKAKTQNRPAIFVF